jgi:hypothetical protein
MPAYVTAITMLVTSGLVALTVIKVVNSLDHLRH